MTPTVPQWEELIIPCDWRTVDFISDLHLHPQDSATFAAWQSYMQKIQMQNHPDADALFILGDLFEVWVGDDILKDILNQPNSFEAQCCNILRATAQYIPVFFMQGNRDFLAGSYFVQHCGITALKDPTVLEWESQRILLSHGDALCLGDVDYQNFRALVRSPAWQQQFLAQPLDERRRQVRSIRNQSEARKQSGAWYADIEGATACEWLRAAGAHTLLHGHTHRPAEHHLADGLARVVLSDWDCTATPPRAQVVRWKKGGEFMRVCVIKNSG